MSALISVIVPVYNRADTILRAVASVMAQTRTDWELLLVDDGSTDTTLAVMEALTDPRIRVLRHHQNRGAAAARNTGIRAAQGEYLAFLDSDDAWHPDKLATQIAQLECAPDNIRASCTGYRVIDGEVEMVRVPALLTHQQMYMGCDLSPGSTLVVRKEVFATVGVNDEGYARYEDWDWVLRYTRQFEMGLVEAPLADIFRGILPSATVVLSGTERLLNNHRDAIDALPARYRRKVLALRWMEVAQSCYRARDFHRGTVYLLRTLAATPWVRPGMYVVLIDAVFGTRLQQGLWWLTDKLRGRQ